MFKKKLLEMEAREEKRTRREMKRREKAEKRAARESLDSRGTLRNQIPSFNILCAQYNKEAAEKVNIVN